MAEPKHCCSTGRDCYLPTDLRAIPRAGQHALLCIYLRAIILDIIVTPLESEVWSGEESSLKRRLGSETRTAFVCKLHTCQRITRTFARTNATFDTVIGYTADGDGSHS